MSIYELSAHEPHGFRGSDEDGRITLCYQGIVPGPNELNWGSDYLLFDVLKPFGFSNQTVSQLIAAPRYEGISLDKLKLAGGIVGAGRVKQGHVLKPGTRFGSHQVEYIIIGQLKPFCSTNIDWRRE